MLKEQSFPQIYEDNNFHIIKIDWAQHLVDGRVEKIEFKSVDFDVVSNFGNDISTVPKLVEVRLKFDINRMVQIATVDYNLDTTSGILTDFLYNIKGEILFSINNQIKIK